MSCATSTHAVLVFLYSDRSGATAPHPNRANRVTGSFVMIEEQTKATVAAGVVGVAEFAAVPPR